MPALLAALLAFGQAAVAQEPLSRDEIEHRLASVDLEIGRLREALAQARESLAREQRSLESMDLAVQESVLDLRRIQSEVSTAEAELAELQAQRGEYLQSLEQRHELLADQMVAAYRLGRQSRLKLLLNQDSPADLSRMLAYYEYFSAAQGERIGELRQALATLDALRTQIDAALASLRQAQSREARELESLREKRQDRQQILDTIAARIDSDNARLEELTRNRKDLETLLERLENALADIPADLGEHLHPRSLRGNLPMPVTGRVLHAFGQSRGGGLDWQGWLIEGEPGSEVSAVAYGRVAFADWLRGYGLLMIIDHGDGFMSLYGNNESLLFEVGDWVPPGTVIGTIGSVPGASQGLYFELRNNGRAVDPAAWVARR